MDAREKRCGERGKSQDREKRSVSRGKRWQGVRFIGTRRRRASTLFLSKPGFRLRSSFSFSPIIFITARDAISFFYPPLSLCQFFLVSSLTIFDSFAFFFFRRFQIVFDKFRSRSSLRSALLVLCFRRYLRTRLILRVKWVRFRDEDLRRVY